jgi:hypothetical protein
MRTRLPQSLPPRLEAGRRRFERWRSQCKARSRIPERLWRTAVELAGEFGVHGTARALRLNYGALKARMSLEQAEPSSGYAPGKFVELFPGTMPAGCKCMVELKDGHGARMLMHLEDADATLLGALASAFVRGGR